ncbi:MAG: hypothetical protein AVDCRST_MAG69-2670, partial [uncultured Solirubrobacteraceae bacterium]
DPRRRRRRALPGRSGPRPARGHAPRGRGPRRRGRRGGAVLRRGGGRAAPRGPGPGRPGARRRAS